MARTFKVGDHVSWNSEAGRVSGTIVAIHTQDFPYKGHQRAPRKTIPNMKSKATRRITSQLTKALPFNTHRGKAKREASAPAVYLSPGVSATAASAVSGRNVNVSCR